MQSGSHSFENLRHFIGVVEDRNDPDFLGRVKVRVYSIHNEQKDQIPVADLPWALVLQPNNAAIQGIGYSGTGMVEGTWVFGIFLDPDFQNPLVLGSLHGKPATAVDKTKGFNDPRGQFPQNLTGQHTLGESSISKLAKGEHAEEHHTTLSKRAARLQGDNAIELAKGPSMSSVISKEVFAQYATRKDPWVEPHPRIGKPDLENFADDTTNYSTYPFCHVYYTESGHVIEVDDTPGMERLHMYHKTGTFQEIQASGTKIEKIVGDNYEIDLLNKHMYVGGDFTLTVDGNMYELIKGNKITEVSGDYLVTVGTDKTGGSYVKQVAGSELKEILSEKRTQVNKQHSLRVSEDSTLTIVGNNTISITGEQKETISKAENKTNLSTLNHTLANNYTVVGTRIDVGSGKELNLAGNNITFKAVNMMDIDAANGFIDFTVGSIDVASGNITDTTVTLNSHKHTQPDTSADATAQGDTGSPVANT